MDVVSLVTIILGVIVSAALLLIWSFFIYHCMVKYGKVQSHTLAEPLQMDLLKFKVSLFCIVLLPLAFLMHTRPYMALLPFVGLYALVYLKRTSEPALAAKLKL